MQSVLSVLTVGAFSFAGWLVVLACLGAVRSASRPAFILLHYALDVVVFGAAFLAYHKWAHRFSPFTTMAIAMLSLFLIEFVFWRFFYSGELWFLNFVDWIVPAFLVASSVYFAGVVLR